MIKGEQIQFSARPFYGGFSTKLTAVPINLFHFNYVEIQGGES